MLESPDFGSKMQRVSLIPHKRDVEYFFSEIDKTHVELAFPLVVWASEGRGGGHGGG